MTMIFGSLFTGIGGLDLGLERSGMTCAFQIENDPFCLKVLKKHWPNVERFSDIKDVNCDLLPKINLIAGGFPCQPHSVAGKRLGSDDERDLWHQFLRIIIHTNPDYVIAENVPGLLRTENGLFFGRIINDLASLGYVAEWDHLPARAFGAYHRRDRVFIVAHSNRTRRNGCIEVLRGKPSKNWPYTADHVSITRNNSCRIRMVPPSGVRRMDDGTSDRVDRLRAIGNAVVPQVAQFIGQKIIEARDKSDRNG